jgi:hypothetical protein
VRVVNNMNAFLITMLCLHGLGSVVNLIALVHHTERKERGIRALAMLTSLGIVAWATTLLVSGG